MPTSFQRLFEILAEKGLQPPPEDIADALWLATRLFDQIEVESLTTPRSQQESKTVKSKDSTLDTSQSPEIQKPSKELQGEGSHSTSPQEAGLHAHGIGNKGGKISGHSIRIPAAPILPRMLEMERALRPLARRMPSKQRWEIDEESTANFVATSNIWNIIRRPVSDRWLEGVLVVEQSPTMRLWQESVREFKHLLWRIGIFRSLETLHIDSFSDVPQLRSPIDNQQKRYPKSICHPDSSRAIFLFTDCLSNAWLSGQIPKWLAFWEKQHPTVIMQMLPDYMWQRTSLRQAKFVIGTSVLPATAPQPLEHFESVAATIDPIPVISLDPKSLRNLSEFLISSQKNRILCYLNDPTDFQEVFEVPLRLPKQRYQPDKKLSINIFEKFKENSSPLALELARYLAIAPLFLPVMRLIQHTLVKKSQPSHLAELFNSGILYRLSPPLPNENANQIEYDFIPGIRDELLGQGSLPRITEVWTVLSSYLSDRFEKSSDFLGILHDPDSVHEFVSGIRDESQRPFARISAAVLRRLGGEYALAAEYLDDITSSSSSPQTPLQDNLEGINKKAEHKKKDKTPSIGPGGILSTVSPYITRDEPFGPIDSVDIDPKDINALKLLFERHNWNYKNMRHRPSMIIGRRGSGKTYLLRSALFENQYDFCVEISTPRALSLVTKVIQRMSKDAFFPEMVSELWEMVIWISIFSEFRKNSLVPLEDLNVINAYLDRMNIQYGENVIGVLSNLARVLDDVMDKNPTDGAAEILKEFDRSKFDNARSVVLKSLNNSKNNYVVLMNSLDDYQLDIDSVSHSLQGLLKLVGSMNKPKDIVDIRICLPSESYHRFIKISSNPNKDFRRALKLQWSAAELVLIGAQRLNFYLAIYYQDFLKSLYPLDIATFKDALRLFQAVLPEKMANQAGFQEDAMSYILRHTQLLPRHFIMLLNSIFKKPGFTQSLNPFPISGDRIINGIRQVEEFMVSEIFIGFKTTYPTAEQTCKRCLPELENIFTQDDLHRVFTRHGKAVFGIGNLFDFQRMLLEIGAIGRVIPGKEKDVYIKGNFEYTVSHELTLGQNDELCLHPLFSSIFRGNDRDRPVYPYGSVLEDDDYRDNDD